MNPASDPGYLILSAVLEKHPDLADKPLLTVSEVARLFGLCKGSVRTYIHNGTLKAGRMGNTFVVTHEHLREFCARCSVHCMEPEAKRRHIRVDDPVKQYLQAHYEACSHDSPPIPLRDICEEVGAYLESLGEPPVQPAWVGRVMHALFAPRLYRPRKSRTSRVRQYCGIRRKCLEKAPA